MITILSPAKSLDFETEHQIGESGLPPFADKAEVIMEVLRQKSPGQLCKLQKISEKLAALNFERNQNWSKQALVSGKQAVLAFQGDVYQGLEAENWSPADMTFAAERLRILSGLYGWLAPHHLILPYRLEMGTPLPVGKAADLYQYWREPLRKYLERQLKPDELILNLASNEYYKALEEADLPNPVLKVDFKDWSKDRYRIISFFAKQARGKMANFVIQNRINAADELKDFNLDGYNFDPASSREGHYVFLRKQK